uniref:Uncharacterized protein AlNc14C469G11824 n=1 Tax=Albugo laibachii Nc14 TaxID=890382 RepID=F0X086_9STRA|nr:conserved hypothetical protein [Albugo laibachii Nc14]|eukprot:CCA27168.1 conserved hypothetical protein [Albugo laibachii Nc14]
MNQTKLSVNSIDLIGIPKEPDATSFEVQVSLHVDYITPFNGTIATSTATLSYSGNDFGNAKIPTIKLPKGHQSVNMDINTSIEITQISILTQMSADMYISKAIALKSAAVIDTSIWGMQYRGNHLQRTFQIAGMNRLSTPPPKVNAIVLRHCSATKYLIDIDAMLDNRSQLGFLDVGYLNMSVYYENQYLGYAMSGSATQGLPRGESNQSFTVSIRNSPVTQKVINRMISGIIGNRAQFFIVGDHPYISPFKILQLALSTFNLSVLYTDGMAKVRIGPDCDMSALSP